MQHKLREKSLITPQSIEELHRHYTPLVEIDSNAFFYNLDKYILTLRKIGQTQKAYDILSNKQKELKAAAQDLESHYYRDYWAILIVYTGRFYIEDGNRQKGTASYLEILETAHNNPQFSIETLNNCVQWFIEHEETEMAEKFSKLANERRVKEIKTVTMSAIIIISVIVAIALLNGLKF